MKGFDYSVLGDSKFYDKMRFLGSHIKNKMYKINYIGLENIPAEGGFIMAANHNHALDPVFIGIPIENRQMHFMAKKELFDNPIAKYFLTKMNGFPIVRGGMDKDALKYAIRVVEEGRILGLFPEGTRSKEHKPGKAKRGVAVIAKAAKAPVLPVSIYNREDMKRGSKITVRFGELIPYEELGFTEEGSKTEEKAVAAYIMERIVDLWRLGHCE